MNINTNWNSCLLSENHCVENRKLLDKDRCDFPNNNHIQDTFLTTLPKKTKTNNILTNMFSKRFIKDITKNMKKLYVEIFRAHIKDYSKRNELVES